jgi:hypothetical protein
MRRATVPALLAALALALQAVGCASSFVDPTGQRTSLENAQREYTKLIRWGEVKRAALYVEPEALEEFLRYAPVFEQIRITDADWDAMGVMPEDGDSAEVEVTYHAYSLATLQEKKVVETQTWKRHGGVKNQWLVRPEVALLAEAFAFKAE